jgi:hypothetical protein
MARASLLCVVTLCAVSAHASRLLGFYPVDDYAHVSPQKSYGEEQTYGDYKDEGQHSVGKGYGGAAQDSDYYSDTGKKGSSGHEKETGFDHSLKSQRKNHEDQGYYGDVSGLKSVYDDGRSYNGAQNYGQKGRNAQSHDSRGGHKKGHNTSGFTKSYHKDESGKKSEFYDSANDEGDHYNYKGQDQGYSGQGADAYKGGYQDSGYRADARGKQGNYGVGSSLEDSQGKKGDYGRQNYYDQRQDYGQKAARDSARQGGGYYDAGAQHRNGGGHASAGFYGGGNSGAGGAGYYY